MNEEMQYAGIINGEETMRGSPYDGKRIYVPVSVWEYVPTEQKDDPMWWLVRFESGDFEDDLNESSVWVE